MDSHVDERPVELTVYLPSDPAALASLRGSVRVWLEGLDVREEDAAAVVAACSEIAADAIEAGSVRVGGGLAGSEVVVRVAGSADWHIEDRPARYVAALLVDDVSIQHTPGETAVVLRKATSSGLN
jgi:anti-sigma regulatory factor (Ser/Thr protein kinase)